MFIGNDWDSILKTEYQKTYFQNLLNFLKVEYKTKKIFPKYEDIFNALKMTPYHNVKVVIIGQDPYHNENQAHGLSFSVMKGTKIPASLHNIFKELNTDLDIPCPTHGDLSSWAKQGVLLLNTVLTVIKSQPGSHRGKGWETFTNKIIMEINKRKEPIVFLLWGNDAKQKAKLINASHHLKLLSTHPSPLSAYRGFFGNKHFSKTNIFLKQYYQNTIEWNLY